jgi:hypothetical protein
MFLIMFEFTLHVKAHIYSTNLHSIASSNVLNDVGLDAIIFFIEVNESNAVPSTTSITTTPSKFGIFADASTTTAPPRLKLVYKDTLIPVTH